MIKNGVDDNMEVIGSKGRKPVLLNVTTEEVNSFREQIELIDLIGCEDIKEFLSKLKETNKKPM